jgi:hypothetical protein
MTLTALFSPVQKSIYNDLHIWIRFALFQNPCSKGPGSLEKSVSARWRAKALIPPDWLKFNVAAYAPAWTWL